MDEENKQNAESAQEEKRGHGCLITVLIFIIIIAIIAVAISVAVNSANEDKKGNNGGNNSSNDKPQIFERDANNGDISFDYEYSFPISINIIIVAKVDIKNLSISLLFADENKQTIKTMNKPVGNLDEGERQEITISLTDFSLSEIFKINYTSYRVTGGTVSVFA